MEADSDIESIRVPETLNDLILELKRIFALDRVNNEYVQTLMTMYKSNPKEWREFAMFDEHRYTRNLVDEGNGKFNLILLCWNENQGSSIHAHANSHCFMKVLEGSVKEEIYDRPSQHQDLSSEPGHHGLKCKKISTFNTNEVAYISDSIGLHRVENPSHTEKAVTLHLYSPPFQECDCFDKMTGKIVVSKMTFWSKFGKRTPFELQVVVGDAFVLELASNLAITIELQEVIVAVVLLRITECFPKELGRHSPWSADVSHSAASG